MVITGKTNKYDKIFFRLHIYSTCLYLIKFQAAVRDDVSVNISDQNACEFKVKSRPEGGKRQS